MYLTQKDFFKTRIVGEEKCRKGGTARSWPRNVESLSGESDLGSHEAPQVTQANDRIKV